MNCLIIDDEFLARELIGQHVSKIPGWQVVAKLGNPMEALPLLHAGGIDLVFLDIQMPEITGIEFLKSLKINHKVVFTTAYSEYALDAFGLDVADYLLKPVSFARFLQCVAKVGLHEYPEPPLQSSNGQGEALILKTSQKLVRVPVADIWMVEGQKEYVCYYTASGHYKVLESLKNIETSLPADRFFRVHKSYIVSLQAIHSMEGNELQIEGGFRVPVGPLYRDTFLQWFTRR